MSHPLPRFFEALIDAIYCIPNLSIMRSCEINVQLSAIYIDMLLQIKFPEDGPKRQRVNGDHNCAQHRTFWDARFNLLELWLSLYTVWVIFNMYDSSHWRTVPWMPMLRSWLIKVELLTMSKAALIWSGPTTTPFFLSTTRRRSPWMRAITVSVLWYCLHILTLESVHITVTF